MNLLDPRFKYIPAAATDVAGTWRRFGFRPVTDEERRARLSRERHVETAHVEKAHLFGGGRNLAATQPAGSMRTE